ncbi:diguanylate cyclase [Rhizobium aquaticum]|uniref:diguanylate cyclase n=1 Tax=Rhizobium aquaticum TaxID=1549636 RepID=A0ABV2IX71_9HYPH
MTPQTPRYKHYDLGRQPAGTVVEVALSSINNVRLMDERNYRLYASSQAYRFLGGLTVKTPTKLIVPANGQWHLVVDREGLPKLANSNVRTIQPGHKQFRVQEADAVDPQKTRAGSEIGAPEQPASEPASATNGEHSPAVMGEILKELHQYKRIANTDALTGLSNRRAFDEKLASVFATGQPHMAALVISDVDHFKKFNDTYGHLVGDKVLTIVAEILHRHAREDIFVARAGGEEFVMVIEGRDPADVLRIAESVRTALEQTPFRDEEAGADYGSITISVGICMKADATDAKDIYSKADSALYASKKGGRNRCTIFDADLQAAS